MEQEYTSSGTIAAGKGGKRVAAPEKKQREKKEKREKAPRRGHTWLVVGIVVVLLVVLAYGGVCGANYFLYNGRALPHTSVLGLDVSGMTATEIERLWKQQGEAVLTEATIDLTRSGETVDTLSLHALGASVLPEDAASAAGTERQDFDAASFLRGGVTLLRRYIEPVDTMPTLTVDSAVLSAVCDTLSDTLGCTLVDGGWRLVEGEGLYITKPRDGERLDGDQLCSALMQHLRGGDLTPVECVYRPHTAQTVDIEALYEEMAGTVVSARYDKATGKPTQSKVGLTFDVDTVRHQLEEAEAGTEFLADAETAFPTVSSETLESAMFRDVLGTCTTYCSGPWGRRENIRLAAKAINGCVYNPGEEFWYNSTVGERTEARGFQPAAAYSGGKTVTSIGGGICQVSSTLYYAALLGDLEIVLRYAHMFDPGYMPVTGCDATVSWGGPDFAFRNSTDYPIKLVTSYNDETNELTVTILGTKTDDHYVVMTNQFLSYEDFKIIYKESDSVAAGEQVVEQYGHNGYAVRTYRNVYAGDGTLLRSTTEATSDYDRGDKIILVAPGEIPE